jgi:hypothetical protein
MGAHAEKTRIVIELDRSASYRIGAQDIATSGVVVTELVVELDARGAFSQRGIGLVESLTVRPHGTGSVALIRLKIAAPLVSDMALEDPDRIVIDVARGPSADLPQAQSPGAEATPSKRSALGEESIPLVSDGGVYKLPARINDTVELKFIIDTGAAEVQLPIDVVLTLMRAETISESDLLTPGQYRLGDGSLRENTRLRIRSLRIGSRRIENVSASIGSVEAPLLLGQSALELLEPWALDTQRQVFLLSPRGARGGE